VRACQRPSLWAGPVGLLALAVALLQTGATALERQAGNAVTYRIDEGRVVVTCPLTVGGSFEAVADVLVGDLGVTGSSAALSGSLAVDLTTLDTGIGLRNRHLRDRYLEVDRGSDFTHAVLTAVVLGAMPPADSAGRTSFGGTLTLHGTSRSVSGDTRIEPHPNGRRVEAEFAISLSSFEIPPPRYLGIGVQDEVRVRVNFVAVEAGRKGDS